MKAPPFNDWRDHVLLPALRIYRARLEGVPIEAISPVVYSFKKDGGIRSIVGFVFRTKALHDSTDQIRCGANFGAPRPLPIDKDVCMPSDEPDMQMGRLDQMYDIALEPLVLTEPIVSPGPAEPTAPAKRKKRKRVHKVPADGRVYLCSKCKAPKRGHVCPFA